MIQNIEIEAADTGTRLSDDAYLAWFSAECECEGALKAWFEGPGDGVAAYLSYREALDREEAAARDLKRLWQLRVRGSESVC
jgi:hypothetical protein